MFSNFGVPTFCIRNWTTSASIACLFFKHLLTRSYQSYLFDIGWSAFTIRQTIKTTSARNHRNQNPACDELEVVRVEAARVSTLICRFENRTVPNSKCGGPIAWRSVYNTCLAGTNGRQTRSRLCTTRRFNNRPPMIMQTCFIVWCSIAETPTTPHGVPICPSRRKQHNCCDRPSTDRK